MVLARKELAEKREIPQTVAEAVRFEPKPLSRLLLITHPGFI